MNKEESNKLADEIVEIGGTWLMDFKGEPLEVVPVKAVNDWTGWKKVEIRALHDAPFKHMFHDGEVSFVEKTAYKYVLPEKLTRQT